MRWKAYFFSKQEFKTKDTIKKNTDSKENENLSDNSRNSATLKET